MTNFETMTIGEAWGKLGRKLAILIPAKLVTWLEAPKREAKRQHPLTVLIVILIAFLSTASVTNLFTRAEFHHPGLSAYATGAGLALLVPLSIFFAVYVPLGRWGRVGAWAISLIFAGMSAAIQYKIYAPGVNQVSLEAIAFGAGIPVAECLLAVLEGILINYLAREAARKVVLAEEQRQAELARIQAEAAAIERKAEAERQRREVEAQAVALAEKQRRVAEVEAQALAEQKRIEAEHQAAQLAFQLEAQRQKLALDLELKRDAARAKLERKNVAKNVAGDVAGDVAEQAAEPENTPMQRQAATLRRNTLLKMLQQQGDIGPVAMGDQLGVNRTTIHRDLQTLKRAKLVHKNSHGWAVGEK